MESAHCASSSKTSEGALMHSSEFEISEKTRELNSQCQKLFDMFEDNDKFPIANPWLLNKILKKFEEIESKWLDYSGESEYDSLVAEAIIEKTNGIFNDISLYTYHFRTMTDLLNINLSRYTLSQGDLDYLTNKVSSANLNVLENTITENSCVRRPVYYDEEAKQVRKVIETAIRENFDAALPSLWDGTFEDYRKTITIDRYYNGAHQRRFNVSIGLKLNFIFEIKDEVVPNYPHIYAIVGEEAILGHQGHYMLTKRADIPSVLKELSRGEHAHSEFIAEFGTKKSLEILANKGTFASYVDGYVATRTWSKIIDSLRKLLAVSIIKGNDMSGIASKYLADYYDNTIWRENIIKITKYDSYAQDVAVAFAHIVPQMYLDDMWDKIMQLDDEIKQKLFEGMWPWQTFKKYLNWLIRDFS